MRGPIDIAGLASAVEQAADGVVLTDTKGEIQYVNPAFTAMTGYEAEEAIGQHTSILKSGQVPGQVYADLWRTIAAGGIWHGELLNRRKNGTTYREDMRIAPVLGNDGAITGYIAIKRDVTERRAAEDAQHFLAAIVESSEDAIAALTPEGTILTWNRGAEVITGYSGAEAVGKPAMAVLEYPEGLQQFLRMVLAGQVVSQYEGVCRHKSGRRLDVSVTGSPIRGDDGMVVAISVVLRDISERRKTEQALRESEEKFRQLAENIPEVFWMVDPETLAVLYISPAYEQVWGRPVESVQKDPTSWFEAIHPEDRHVASRMLQVQAERRAVATEFRVQWPDGSEKWVRDKAFPVLDARGKVVRVVGIAEDITECKRYERELIEAREAADDANRAKSLFLANMSHEIRTPMNGVMGVIQLLQQSELTEEQRDLVGVAQASGQTLLTLIDDLLDHAKIEAGRVVLENAPFCVRDTLANLARLNGVQAAPKGLAVEWHADADVPVMLRGDVHRLRQVLNNLTGNAVKFTEQGKIRIGVSLESLGNETITLVFAVSDTGVGIPPSQVESIFSAFVQADPSTTRRYGGTGLGLTISRELVELMGGKLTVETREGHGSTFHFTSRFRRAGSQAPAASLRVRLPAAPAQLQGAKILVVEDNPTNQRLALAQLRRLGYNPIAVGNGADAVTAVAREPFDLVLMDCQMPVMDGFEATRRIRELHSSELPIVAVTANAMAADRERCLHGGMNDYLAKPVDLKRLAEVLERWLRPPA